jgi:5,10-methylenetetrahydromethanopterin reductase
VAAVSTTVTAVRQLFDGKRVDAWSEAAYMRFQTRRIPIYIGAMSPRMLALIGAVADGGLPLLFPPEHFASVRALVADGATAAGRSLSEVDLAACIWCSVSADRVGAERALREKIAYYGYSLSPTILTRLGLARSDFARIRQALQVDRDLELATELVTPEMLRMGVVGTAADLLPRLEWLVAAGASHLSFGPPLGPDPFEAIEVLGRQVLPHFR